MGKATGKGKAMQAKQWTIMVYLAGDNNLDAAGVTDLKEMKKVGSSAAVNLLAQFDREGTRKQTKRYYLQKGTPAAKDVVQSLGETNCGDPRVLQDFVAWAVKNYPARHYMLVLWNHGAGWDDSNIFEGDTFGGAPPPVVRKGMVVANLRGATRGAVPMHQVRAALKRARRSLFASSVARAIATRAIAFDDQAQDYLDNIELKRVLGQAKKAIKRKIDILGMDACLMSMAEVAYQVKGAADYMVSSQQTEPNNGWPYDRVLKALVAKPSMTPDELSRQIVKDYLASYGPNEGVTLAATDLAKLTPLSVAVDQLAKLLREALGDAQLRSALMNARAQVQEYEPPYDEYVDLVDLCDLLTHYAGARDVANACAQVKQAVAASVIASGAKGKSVANSNGASIYFPKKRISPLYAKLDFVKKNAWNAFLGDYLAGVARRPGERG